MPARKLGIKESHNSGNEGERPGAVRVPGIQDDDNPGDGSRLQEDDSYQATSVRALNNEFPGAFAMSGVDGTGRQHRVPPQPSAPQNGLESIVYKAAEAQRERVMEEEDGRIDQIERASRQLRSDGRQPPVDTAIAVEHVLIDEAATVSSLGQQDHQAQEDFNGNGSKRTGPCDSSGSTVPLSRRLVLSAVGILIIFVAVIAGVFFFNTSDGAEDRASENVQVLPEWKQLGADLEGNAAGDSFGYAVDLSADGKIVAVGAAESPGYVRVLQYNSSEKHQWSQLGASLYGDNDSVSGYSYFGYAVALSADGTTLAVGSPGIHSPVPGSALVFRYDRVENKWNQLGDTLVGETAGDFFGASIDISSDGTIMAVGAYKNDGAGEQAGHVRVFRYRNANWAQLTADLDGEATGDMFGFSVALSAKGTILAVGAPYNDGNGPRSGHVKVFEYNSSRAKWKQLGPDFDGNDAWDLCGSSVALSSTGTTLAIGATLNDRNVSVIVDGGRVVGYRNHEDAGHVRVYHYHKARGNWSQLGSSLDGEARDDGSGTSVALSSDGTILTVGAIQSGGNGEMSGQVRVFQYRNGTWDQLGPDLDGEAAGDWFGWAVALSADGTILAGASRYHDGDGTPDSGHVRVFQRKATDK